MIGGNVRDGGALNQIPHLYVAGPIGDRLAVGCGFNVPFCLETDYGETWVGRYHATRTALRVCNLSPSFAARLYGRMSVGVGLNLRFSDVVLANMIDFGSLGASSGLGLVPQRHDGGVQIEGGDFAVGYGVGLLWEPEVRTRMGLTFRSKTIHRLEGPATFDVPPEARPLTGGGTVFQNTTATVELPMTASVSASRSTGRR